MRNLENAITSIRQPVDTQITDALNDNYHHIVGEVKTVVGKAISDLPSVAAIVDSQKSWETFNHHQTVVAALRRSVKVDHVGLNARRAAIRVRFDGPLLRNGLYSSPPFKVNKHIQNTAEIGYLPALAQGFQTYELVTAYRLVVGADDVEVTHLESTYSKTKKTPPFIAELEVAIREDVGDVLKKYAA